MMNNTKWQYEEISVEIINMSDDDIITTSSPFDGEGDKVTDW